MKIQGKMKHVLGGMSFPELLMRSIHAESTCLLQGHQVRILTFLDKKKKSFFQSICFEHYTFERKSDPKQILSSILHHACTCRLAKELWGSAHAMAQY